MNCLGYDKNGSLQETENEHVTVKLERDPSGRVKECTGEKDFIPFRYQGQYEDIEIGLYYNRFRYYDPEQGNYTQVDPIGLAGGNPTLYGYVSNPNVWIDILGLSCTKELKKNMNRANKELAKSEGYMKRAWYKEKGSAAHHIVAGDDARAQPARELKKNMNKANRELKKNEGYMKRAWYKEKGSAAHHIVTGDHSNFHAGRTREILKRLKIDVNSAENGVYLKHVDLNSLKPGAYQRVIQKMFIIG